MKYASQCCGNCGLGEHPQSQFGPVTVDFLDVEGAHEIQDFLTDDLTWHQNGKARRIRDDEAGRYVLTAALHLGVDFVGIDRHVLAMRIVVGKEIGAAHVRIRQLAAVKSGRPSETG